MATMFLVLAFWAGGMVATAAASLAEQRANPHETWRLEHTLGLLVWPFAWVVVFRRGRV